MTGIAPTPMRVEIVRLHDHAVMPTQAKRSDAGYDLCAIEDDAIYPGCRTTFRTGIAVAIPEGYVGYIKPRSGLAAKHGIDVLAGVIDSGYRGEIGVVLYNTDRNQTFVVTPGDRIAQLVIQPVMGVDFRLVGTLPASERLGSGFGSTGVR